MHQHVVLFLTDGLLTYYDPRRFGSFEILNGPVTQIEQGVEPLQEELSANYLYQKSSSSSASIKSLIMNNKVVVGIGNIYACESLWRARILPSRIARECMESEINVLVPVIKDILQRAISAGGSTIKDYRKGDGIGGLFQLEHSVYGRNGVMCRDGGCSGIIIKTSLAGRATYHCPICQT